ncbi:FMN-binding negative transcriptional regulator [Inhella gelatinilytica]|uniref:FMN-binding negative transcriptional regulator n=1 Tax=Inhella gelatinilytica TaxID=2795030 RepID=A0A931ISY3_9BURK|nr:FMN-binding negative transcriptional regulator [Inhella gelatinilytica]MBH9552142.1 FMN-binding negative transcriptional regulator [Inhella gelatinilytica]
MYTPPYTVAAEADSLALLRAHPLGTVAWQGPSGLEATPLPWLLRGTALSEGLRLAAHAPRANPLVQRALAQPQEVLVIFQGVQGYISPNWYPSKAQFEKMVPTWNYSTVHVHGRLRAIDDPNWVREQLIELTARYEANEPEPWTLEQAAPGFIDQLQRALVGLELTVTRIEGKAKLSQNREEGDQRGAIQALRQRGEHGLAEAMEQARDGHVPPSSR